MDDLVIGIENLVNVNKAKSLLSDKFEMTDMKELRYFLLQSPKVIMICHYITL